MGHVRSAGRQAIIAALRDALDENGFSFVDGKDMPSLLGDHLCVDFRSFAASWDRLGDDRFMADGGRYRRRRHATFRVEGSSLERNAPRPHYQSRDYNMLNGGIERWFDPVEPVIAEHPLLAAIVCFGSRIFGSLSSLRQCAWHVEVHQFRIEAGEGNAGHPTPEGLHRDGVDRVLVMLIARQNVDEGVTKIHDLAKEEIGSFRLSRPFDTALVDDHRVYHAVTPIVPMDDDKPAYRDALVITYKIVDRIDRSEQVIAP